jgi:hypothetical protein
MSELKRFKIVGVSHKAEHKAGRYALSSVLATAAVEGTDAVVATAVASLFDRRRHRLLKLREAGYSAFQDERLFTYTMNCPPVGVLTNRLAMIPCSRVPLCPFCWCRRYVGTTLKRYQNYLLPVGAPHLRVELVEIKTSWILSFERWSVPDVFTFAKDSRSCRLPLSSKQPGGTVLTAVDVVESGWRVSHHALVVRAEQPAAYEYPLVQPEGSEGAKPHRSLRRTRLWYAVDEEPAGAPAWILNAAIGRLARYPEGLLSGDAGKVCELLNYMRAKRLRLLEHYGVLRGKLEADLPETTVADDLSDSEGLSRENF